MRANYLPDESVRFQSFFLIGYGVELNYTYSQTNRKSMLISSNVYINILRITLSTRTSNKAMMWVSTHNLINNPPELGYLVARGGFVTPDESRDFLSVVHTGRLSVAKSRRNRKEIKER